MLNIPHQFQIKGTTFCNWCSNCNNTAIYRQFSNNFKIALVETILCLTNAILVKTQCLLNNVFKYFK